MDTSRAAIRAAQSAQKAQIMDQQVLAKTPLVPLRTANPPVVKG